MAFDPAKFATATPKSIPVLLLLDVSSSMLESCREESISKIDALNNALQNMTKGFKEAQTLETFI